MKHKFLQNFIVGTCVAASLVSWAGAFSDVPAGRWSEEGINTLAEGGLMEGYEDGLFHPEDAITVDQMATLVARLAGGTTGYGSGYWAYKALDFCANTNGCLPADTTITSAEYDVPCTREFALHMLVAGVGTNTPLKQYISKWDIPDVVQINEEYLESIITAYEHEITTGVDEAGTFDPKATITREEIATMMYRAGYTTAATAPEEYAEGKLNGELFEDIRNMGISWTETVTETSINTTITLTAAEAKYGGINVSYIYKEETMDNGTIKILAPELNKPQMYDASGNVIDTDGNYIGIAGQFDANGIAQFSSGYSYEARMLILDILYLIYPTSKAEVKQELMDMFQQETHEYKAIAEPSALGWYDGRMFEAYMMDYPSYNLYIYIGMLGDTDTYQTDLTREGTGQQTSVPYTTPNGYVAFEMDKW